MHANLGYQPEVSTKFWLNQTAHGLEIPIFVRYSQTDSQQQTTHESQKASKTKVRWTKIH